MVEPLTCVVYCEAPTTVARMPSFERSIFGPQLFDPRTDFLGQQRAEIAERSGFAAVDVFRHAAGERDLGDRATMRERIEPAQAMAIDARRAALHGLEQALGHARRHLLRVLRRERAADFQLDAKLGGKAPAGFLDARDAAAVVEADEAGADVDGGEVDHLAVGAKRDLRGATADVDVHHNRVVAHRAGGGAGAISGHHRFEVVAGRDRDHLAGLRREQFADLAGVAPAHGDTGQDQGAGIDLLRIDLGLRVLARDEGAELVGVDGLLAVGRIGREQNVGLIEGLALGHHVAAVEPFQHDAREHQMRRR